MGTTRQHPPGDLGREPEGAGVGARADAGIRADAGVGAPSSGQVESAERQWRTLSLRQVSGIVPTARDFARQALHDWGWLPASSADRRAAAEDVLLVVSELVTNACLHADGPDELRIARSSKALRVEVADGGAGQPAPRTPHRAGRPGGHGMFIVQRLCLDWGVVRVPGEPGKTVWAELAAPV
ncbi:ATP-binding protein [Streptomyces sp. NBC_00338]|uniref:ATP-binding protein n=1 Tax=Streptomyces sp. NBC_00338 TaxID=2975715 RepID=UPI00224DE635|nr:ATP-binding protein [Streptomyces sp. NBC_00338]MCX5140699.1 ATP-binding protein [Streptomyces sp. NBC_00338]